MKRFRTTWRRVFLVSVACLIAIGVPTWAFGAFPDSDVKTYTGCLSLSSGALSLIAEGNSPKAACSGSQVQVKLSGGDMTSTRTPASGGLQGGAENGAASLELQQSYKLPQACGNGQVAKSDGVGAWACGNDSDSGGDITGVNTPPGSGLTGGASSGEVNLGLGTSFKLPQTCANNQVTKWNGTTWVCAADNDTTYSGANFATSNQDCTGAQFAKGIGANGTLNCADVPAAPASGIAGYQIVGSGDKVVGLFGADDNFAGCPSGKVVIGGGVKTGLSSDRLFDGNVLDTYPKSNGWFGRVYNPGEGAGLHFEVYAICATA